MKPAIVIFTAVIYSSTLTRGQYYYHGLMDYLENRMLAIEDRMEQWQEQSHRYRTDLQDFQKLVSEFVEGLGKEHSTLSKNLDVAAVRIDRAEREMDYRESRSSPRACVNKADKVLEDAFWSEAASRANEREGGTREEVHSRVADCRDIIYNIRSVKIFKRAGGSKGTWIRDPRSSKVYVFNGTDGDSVHQFNSLQDFSSSAGLNGSRQVRVPSLWEGAGSTVYDGYLYYVTKGADTEIRVVKYDLRRLLVTDTAMFPVESHAPIYSLNPETVADIAADSEGLWLLYASNEGEQSINLAKMDRATLDIEQMWDTRCPRENAEAAFIVCGTLYVVYNTRLASRARVQCVFDVNDMMVHQEAPLLYFPRRYGAHASVKYNPEEKQLYAWDDGYQIIYRLTMNRKLLV